ncbi:HNH endonuclease, partial [Blastococcus sp. CT_GayMR19]|uniref:HNH endonuclease signature motif containing protein n=1 Tax=Blastococcus sp. CT_GayMR19 TaxID=2559608 RepID=UPI0010737574
TKSTASWLRTHTRLSEGAARRLVEAGRVLDELPAVQQAYATGAISAEAVTTIAPVATPARLARAAEQGVDVAEIAATLAVLATEVSHRRLREAVGYYTRHLDPDGTEPDPTEGRSLTMSRLLGGAFSGTFSLDAVGGEKVATALESIAAASRCAGDMRTAAQVRGDALVQLCDLALASGQLPILRTVKPHVGVLIGIEDLIDPATGVDAATTGMGAAISAGRARWIACDATVGRIVLGPDSAPLDLGRDQRVAPPHLRRAVELRDQSCVFAGCEAPAWWCEVHHVLHWGDGGETCLENSALLCERHHGKVHHGFTIVRDPDGRWHTYRPDGTEIVLSPLL